MSRINARNSRANVNFPAQPVRQGPAGLLYLLTDEKEGAVQWIEPAPVHRNSTK